MKNSKWICFLLFIVLFMLLVMVGCKKKSEETDNGYAGTYINEEGKTVVLYKIGTKYDTELRDEHTNEAGDIIYKYTAKYSKKELEEIMDKISEYCESEKYKKENFDIWGWE